MDIITTNLHIIRCWRFDSATVRQQYSRPSTCPIWWVKKLQTHVQLSI